MNDLNIYQRVNEIRKEIGYLQKDAAVQGYKAVTHDHVTSAVRQHLIEYHVVIVPKQLSGVMVDTGSVTAKGVAMMRYEASYEIDFVNADNPDEKVTVPISSHANDYGDKAPGKALSYATKYAMLKLFSIETGESDEARDEQKPAAKAIDLKNIVSLGMAIERHKKAIHLIKQSIATKNYSAGAEAWFEMSEPEQRSIWAVPSKGGTFTTAELKTMKSSEWREAHYGQDVTKSDENSTPAIEGETA